MTTTACKLWCFVSLWLLPTEVLAEAEPVPEAVAVTEIEIDVVALRPRRDAFEVRHHASAARTVAGTGGDALKIVEDLPGVARAPLGSNQLLLWGGAPDDTRVYVDGVEIPRLLHDSAIRSTLGSNLIQDVSVTPGAYGADYGRGIGGLVQVRTKELDFEPKASVELSVLDVSTMGSGALGTTRGAVSARWGLLDRVLDGLGVGYTGPFLSVPHYWDLQLKTQLELSSTESLDVVGLASSDTTTRDAADETQARDTRREASFNRLYAVYRRSLDAGEEVRVVPWVGRDHSSYRATFGDSPQLMREDTTRFGVRAERRAQTDLGALTLGIDTSAAFSALERRGSLTLPAREGDRTVFGQRPAADTNADAFDTRSWNVAPYISCEVTLGPLVITPQLRADGYLLESSRLTPRVGQTPAIGTARFDMRAHPRLQASFAAASQLTLLAAVGTFSQPPRAADASAVFGNPELGPEEATHLAAGEQLQISERVVLSTTAFYKWLRHLTVRENDATPRLAHALNQSGVGRAYGFQTLIELRPWRGFAGFVAHTMSRSERSMSEGGTRLFDYDQPQVVTLSANYTFDRWAFGVRARYASGMPRTDVVSAVFNSKDGVFEPVFGSHNGIRIPPFFQLDVRVDRSFVLGRTVRCNVSLEVINATSSVNVEEFVYNDDYTKRGFITGLPLLGVLGARLEL